MTRKLYATAGWRVDTEILDLVDRYAASHHISKNASAMELIRRGFEAAEREVRKMIKRRCDCGAPALGYQGEKFLCRDCAKINSSGLEAVAQKCDPSEIEIIDPGAIYNHATNYLGITTEGDPCWFEIPRQNAEALISDFRGDFPALQEQYDQIQMDEQAGRIDSKTAYDLRQQAYRDYLRDTHAITDWE